MVVGLIPVVVLLHFLGVLPYIWKAIKLTSIRVWNAVRNFIQKLINRYKYLLTYDMN